MKKKRDLKWFFAYGKPWICKWWIWVLLALLISIPFIINCLYLKGTKLSTPNTSFSASDMLGFYGNILAFLGTIALGALALWQNYNIYSNSEKSELRRFAMTNFPLFEFYKLEYEFLDELNLRGTKKGLNDNDIKVRGFNGNKMIWKPIYCDYMEYLSICFTIRNIGTVLATSAYICDENEDIVENTSVVPVNVDSEENDKMFIMPDNIGKVFICIPLKTLEKENSLVYVLRYQSPYSTIYSQKIEVKTQANRMILFETHMTIDIKE